MYKKIGFALACLLSMLIFFSLKGVSSDPDTLVIGTNSEYPPFSFQKNGEIVGFDIDVAKEVCKRLNKKCTLKDMPFDALIPDLTFGNIDFIAAGVTYTAERAQRVAFAKPHFGNDPLVILTLPKPDSTSSKSLDDLKGKTVVVNEGYTADLLLTGQTNFQLLRLAAPADAFMALKNGRADAFVTAQSTVNSFLETQNDLRFQMDIINGTPDNYALVVSKKNPELLTVIQAALDSMEKDGTLAQIKNKWKLQ